MAVVVMVPVVVLEMEEERVNQKVVQVEKVVQQ